MLVLIGAALAACSNLSEVDVKKETVQNIAAAGLAYKIIKPAGGDLLLLGLAYLVYDPLAPNWEIEETRLKDDVFRFELRMKAHFTGGEGEAMALLKRRAEHLQRELGYHNYRILNYAEGIESRTLASRRYGEARIQLLM
ncbi:MAG: hypothetical protein LBS89_06320 [Zoogloeaceae bacterium]|nr:hypothetical protein [Zoogloeaceae bacterium]